MMTWALWIADAWREAAREMRRLLDSSEAVSVSSGEAMNVLGRSKGIAILAPHSADEKSKGEGGGGGGGRGEEGRRDGASVGDSDGGDGDAVDYVVERLR